MNSYNNGYNGNYGGDYGDNGGQGGTYRNNNGGRGGGRRGDAFSFDIKVYMGVLGTHKNGWRKEVNLISWNGNPPKLDIRDWDPQHTRMSKGLTFSEEEAMILYRILSRRYQNAEPEVRDGTGGNDMYDECDDREGGEAQEEPAQADE